MEDPALFPLNSKKRILVEKSSSSKLGSDDDVIEIPPPASWKSKPPKKKNLTVSPEIIDVDDEDPDDVVIIHEKIASKGKGKKPMLTLDGAPSQKANGIGKSVSNSSATSTSSSSLSRKKTNFKVLNSFKPLKSLISKSADYVSKLRSFKHPTTSTTAMIPPESQFPGKQSPVVKSVLFSCNNASLEDGITTAVAQPSTEDLGSSHQNSILKKLELFKKFDTLEDHSDHLYDKTQESSQQQSKGWANKIAEEWRLLEKHLPDTIYVRAYESRMDLLRAVIVGADGTPYHDGLFFFDVQFPASYPNKPPLVKYHAHGLRINPNLYNSGYVCLSLLGTWSGSGNEKWLPLNSNTLQVLVSIQGLVLNAEPYYNEPGYAHSKNVAASKAYSENAFLLSLKTMLDTIKNPPKNFEDLVFGHFYSRSHDILAACTAYLDGVQVGSYDKDKTETKHAKKSKKTCSKLLRKDLPNYIKSLVKAFTKIGVTDCEKYL